MGIKHVLGVLIWIIFFNSLILQTNALSPYKILGVPRTATDSEVDVKYRQLRGKYRRNRMKKNMVKQAYDQIMIERKFQEGI